MASSPLLFEAERLEEPKAHHELIVSVEFCQATRPSATLKGSHEKYEECFARVGETLALAKGAGECTVQEKKAATAPRLGSFEVSIQLRNKDTKVTHGPTEVYSKLQTRQWPSGSNMLKRVKMELQPFLAKDAGRELPAGLAPGAQEQRRENKKRFG